MFVQDNTMYVAGTKSVKDALDDVLIPMQLTRFSDRYISAATMAKETKPDRVVGHSLGGAVALELGPKIGAKTETYGAPVISLKKSDDRHAHWGDPIAILDRGATRTVRLGNPHSYSGYKGSSRKP